LKERRAAPTTLCSLLLEEQHLVLLNLNNHLRLILHPNNHLRLTCINLQLNLLTKLRLKYITSLHTNPLLNQLTNHRNKPITQLLFTMEALQALIMHLVRELSVRGQFQPPQEVRKNQKSTRDNRGLIICSHRHLALRTSLSNHSLKEITN